MGLGYPFGLSPSGWLHLGLPAAQVSASPLTHPPFPHNSVAVTRSDDTPPFGPPIAVGQRFPRGPQLRHFLLAKAINGENAASRGGRLGAMAARTRHQYLRELARSHANGPPPAAPTRGLPVLGVRRRVGVTVGGDAVVGGALVWGAKAWVGQGGEETACLLGVAAERVVLVTPQEGRVLLSAACRDVLGWAYVEGGVEIFYGAGESVGLRLPHGEAEQVVARLQVGVWGGGKRVGLGGDGGLGSALGSMLGSMLGFMLGSPCWVPCWALHVGFSMLGSTLGSMLGSPCWVPCWVLYVGFHVGFPIGFHNGFYVGFPMSCSPLDSMSGSPLGSPCWVLCWVPYWAPHWVPCWVLCCVPHGVLCWVPHCVPIVSHVGFPIGFPIGSHCAPHWVPPAGGDARL